MGRRVLWPDRRLGFQSVLSATSPLRPPKALDEEVSRSELTSGEENFGTSPSEMGQSRPNPAFRAHSGPPPETRHAPPLLSAPSGGSRAQTGLRRQSPQNGNFRGWGRRLSAISRPRLGERDGYARQRSRIRSRCDGRCFVGTKRMLARVTASQIASASAMSFFWRLT